MAEGQLLDVSPVVAYVDKLRLHPIHVPILQQKRDQGAAGIATHWVIWLELLHVECVPNTALVTKVNTATLLGTLHLV